MEIREDIEEIFFGFDGEGEIEHRRKEIVFSAPFSFGSFVGDDSPNETGVQEFICRNVEF